MLGAGFFNFSSFFVSLRSYPWWQVTLELLVIGSVVLWIVRFLQGTRGARLVRGIALLLIGLYLVVELLGSVLDLERIKYLYSGFLIAVSFAVVVVFQPELRRALMRLGETRLFRPSASLVGEQVDQLVEASLFCARRKIGALIAIERDVGLGGIAESGQRLDAEMSAALLNTIFWPNSPLHDLGVIISQGKVSYAGVQFPLAESGELEKELGSRHRAAVGMSQESDAVVLVVSEETGDISIAERGVLMRKLTPEALHDLLTDLLGGASTVAPNGMTTRRMISFRRPLRALQRLAGGSPIEMLKTMAVVVPLSILVWIYAERAQVIKDEHVQIQLDVEAIEPQLSASITQPMSIPSISLTLSGSRSRIDALKNELTKRSPDGIYKTHLPYSMASGTVRFVDVVPMLSLDPVFKESGVSITESNIPVITVQVDNIVDREIRVAMPADLQVSVTQSVFEPATIKLRGPKPELDRLFDGATPTIAVDLSSVLATVQTVGPHKLDDVPLRLPRSNHITSDRKSVAASFTVGQRDEEYTIPSVTIFVQRPLADEGKYRVDTQKTLSNVRVKGPAEQIALLKGDNPQKRISAVLRCAGETVGKDGRRAVELIDLPTGITLAEAAREVDYTVKEPLAGE